MPWSCRKRGGGEGDLAVSFGGEDRGKSVGGRNTFFGGEEEKVSAHH
jgi:hypothetical protein